MGKPERYAEVLARIAGAAPESKYIRGKGMPPPGRIPAMLAARRGMIDLSLSDLSPPKTIPRSPAASLLVEQSKSSGAAPQWSSDLADRVGYALQEAEAKFQRGEVAGRFGPLVDLSRTPTASEVFGIVAYPRGDRATRRHELMHGYTEAALQGHAGLPPWSRAVANMPEWLRRPVDELGAQRVGGASFRDIPWDQYAKTYAEQNLLGASRVARVMNATTRAAQFTAENPEAALVAGGLGLMGYRLAQPGAIGAGAGMQGQPQSRPSPSY